MNKKKFHLAGEVALLIVLLINSLGVDLMSKSEFGISTISSVPLVFNIMKLIPFLPEYRICVCAERIGSLIIRDKREKR